jgi:hypothetical protein
MKNSPMVDFTCINGIQSMLSKAERKSYLVPRVNDPWGSQMLSNFADFFIYYDSLRYSIPYRNDQQLTKPPDLLKRLIDLNTQMFTPEEVDLQEDKLDSKDIGTFFVPFARWATINRTGLQVWSSLHSENWIRRPYEWAAIKESLLFEAQELNELEGSKKLRSELNLSDMDICYAFDVSLRQLVYGKRVGEDNFYITDPIRHINLPNIRSLDERRPVFPLRFGRYIAEIARGQTIDEFVAILMDAKEAAKDFVKPFPNQIPSQDMLREISKKLQLRDRLKKFEKPAFVLGTLGGYLTLSVDNPVKIAGYALEGMAALMQASDIFMKNKSLPSFTSGFRWLRFISESPLEIEARRDAIDN